MPSLPWASAGVLWQAYESDNSVSEICDSVQCIVGAQLPLPTGARGGAVVLSLLLATLVAFAARSCLRNTR